FGVFWRLRARGNEHAALPLPVDPEFWRAKPSTRALLSRWLGLALRAAALFFVVAGLTRPQKISSKAHDLGRGIDIMLAFDSSLSMSATDLSPSRIEAAKETALKF